MENVPLYLIPLLEWKAYWNVEDASEKGSAIWVINVVSIGTLVVLDFSLYNKGYSCARIAKDKGMERVFLIQHKMIS